MKATLNDFKDIQDLLERDAGLSLTQAYVDDYAMQRVFLAHQSDYAKNELMLRLDTYKKRLVVARIAFENKRQGYGEQLLSLLTAYGANHDYQTLIFEEVQTEGMRNFVMKHGFEQAPNHTDFDFNWFKKIQ